MRKFLLFMVLSALICFSALAQKDTACDVITLTNGKLIYCKAVSKKSHVVSYRPCNNPNGQPILINADSVLMVNHPNGSYESVSSIKSSGSYSGTDNKADMYIAITGGMGIPVFSFNAPPISQPAISLNFDNVQGFALLGNNINIQFCLPQKNSVIGFGAVIGYNSNGFDVDSYSNFLSISYLINPGTATYGATVTSKSTGNYISYKALLGPVLTFVSGKCSFDIKLLIGGAYCTFPSIKYSYYIPYATDSAFGTETLSATGSLGFALQLGLGFRYSFSEKISALLNADIYYAASNLSVPVENTVGYRNGQSQEYLSILGQKSFCLLNISAGIGFSIGK